MLQFFRKNTKAIVWSVVVAFVLWGGLTVGTQFEGRVRSAGKVFGKEISHRDYLAARKSIEIYTPPPAEGAPPPPAEQIEAQTWILLAVSHEARRLKIKVTDDEVRKEILGMMGLQNDWEVPTDQYARWIQGIFREQPHEFENHIRQYLAVRKLLGQVRSEAKENPEEAVKKWHEDLLARAQIQIQKTSTG